MSMTPKERLMAAAAMQALDRPPCICPGGMMNMMFRDIMVKTGCLWPEAHSDPDKMAGLAAGLYDAGGFENYGVPFCMTVEAEAMGARVEMGDLLCEPHVVDSPLTNIKDWQTLTPLTAKSGRVPVVLEAIRRLKARNDGVPVIGNINGPTSVAGELIAMEKLLPAMRKDPESVHGLMGFVADQLIAYGRLMLEAGADFICLAEPSGTGEVVGPKYFREFTVPYINKVMDALDTSVKMVHMCGRLQRVYEQLPDIHSDIFSFDAVVPISEVRKVMPERALMGNVSTLALQETSPEHVRSMVHYVRGQGIDIVAPACGLPTVTPLPVIQAMVEAAKEPMA